MLKKHGKKKAHVALPKETPAWVCAKCNKVSVNAELLCEPQEMPLP